MGTAQWVERPTEKPGAILTRVRVPHEAARYFFSPRVNFQCRLSSLTVSVQPPRAVAYINICAVKIPDTGSHTNV